MNQTTTTIIETLKHGRRSLTALGALLVAATFALAPAPVVAQQKECGDLDQDGICNGVDNCMKIPNPLQHNSNEGPLGDACDCDYNQDKMVDEKDFLEFQAHFNETVDPSFRPIDSAVPNEEGVIEELKGNATNGIFDHNEDGEINIQDYITFQGEFGTRVNLDGG